MALYLWYVTHGYVDFCRDVDRSIRPWIFPLLPGTPGAFITVYLGFVLLLSDAPFRSRQQQFVLQRWVSESGRRAAAVSVPCLSGVYAASLGPDLDLSFTSAGVGMGLGPVLTTVAASGISPEYGVWDWSMNVCEM